MKLIRLMPKRSLVRPYFQGSEEAVDIGDLKYGTIVAQTEGIPGPSGEALIVLGTANINDDDAYYSLTPSGIKVSYDQPTAAVGFGSNENYPTGKYIRIGVVPLFSSGYFNVEVTLQPKHS